MKGLIIKDLYGLKKGKNMYLILTAILVFYCIIRHMYSFITLMPILIFGTLITSTFSMDSHVKWNKLAVAAPLSRKEIVKSKYVLLLIIIGLGMLTGTLLSLPWLIMQNISFLVLLEMTLFAMGIALCSGSLSIGFVYLSKNAIEKMELLTIFSYAGAAVIVIGTGKLLNLANRFFHLSTISISIINFLVILVMVLVTSYKISVHAFSRQDIA